jgi:hypothetical protein
MPKLNATGVGRLLAGGDLYWSLEAWNSLPFDYVQNVVAGGLKSTRISTGRPRSLPELV